MPLSGDARPAPKSSQLARGKPKYRRIVAGPKRWQAIVDEKQGPCRTCVTPAANGSGFARIQFHHLVTREDHGDDVPDNIVPLCIVCHDLITQRYRPVCLLLMDALTDAEYSYMVQRGGESYPERAYGVEYAR